MVMNTEVSRESHAASRPVADGGSYKMGQHDTLRAPRGTRCFTACKEEGILSQEGRRMAVQGGLAL